MADVNWTAVFTSLAGVVGTLIAVVLGPRLILSKDRRLRGDELARDAQYLAIRVICLLDMFVIECCKVANDSGEPKSNGEWGEQVKVPTIELPDDVNWKAIEHSYAYRILSIPSLQMIADQNIRDTGEYSSPPEHPEYFESRQNEYAHLGLTTSALTNDLRAAFNLPREPPGRWDPKSCLEDALARVAREREKREAAGLIELE